MAYSRKKYKKAVYSKVKLTEKEESYVYARCDRDATGEALKRKIMKYGRY